MIDKPMTQTELRLREAEMGLRLVQSLERYISDEVERMYRVLRSHPDDPPRETPQEVYDRVISTS